MLASTIGRVKCAAHIGFILGTLLVLRPHSALGAGSVTLAWDASNDPNVAGYNLYYGAVSRTYTNTIPVGGRNSATISNLAAGRTYYFAATAVTSVGLESDYSDEASYTVPTPNQPPTLNPLSNVSLVEDAGQQTVNLTGISSGSASEAQTLAISAASSNPGLIPNPTVNYTSPNTTGTLVFTPQPKGYGSATITVLVDDGGTVSNTLIRSFTATVNPVNDAPTLDALSDLTLNENAGLQTVPLSGISSGASNENQPLSIVAVSSNPLLIPNPTVNYTSPNATGSLAFTPVTNAYGAATITVTVNDGQPSNNIVGRTFAVTVTQDLSLLTVLTNALIKPNVCFIFKVPHPNDDKLTFSLDPGAPAGALISPKKGTFYWKPTSAQACTTNIITVRIADNDVPESSTTGTLVLRVTDYLYVSAGATAVQAGQNATVPIWVDSSEGVTNLVFGVTWPSNRFTNPTLSAVAPAIATDSLQDQGTNLLISLQTKPSLLLQGSNVLFQLNFQTVQNQHSAFVPLPVGAIAGSKPAGAYANCAGFAGEVAMVGEVPLARALLSGTNRTLAVYGKVGTNYQLLCTTSLNGKAAWTPLFTYTHTNVAQKVTVGSSSPLILYRLQQR